MRLAKSAIRDAPPVVLGPPRDHALLVRIERFTGPLAIYRDGHVEDGDTTRVLDRAHLDALEDLLASHADDDSPIHRVTYHPAGTRVLVHVDLWLEAGISELAGPRPVVAAAR